jgi:parvulin-like peptidyl-prolyl isomerase
MSSRLQLAIVSFVLFGLISSIPAQAPPPSPPPLQPATDPKAEPKRQLPPPPPATAVAASVNGQDIPEMAVYRAFLHDPASFNAENRKDLINHLVDNVLVDQYLSQLKIEVKAEEVAARFEQIAAEAKKSNNSLKDMLGKMFLTEDDLRKELLNSLRWEKFVAQQATEKVLREMFEKNTSMFDGTMVGARHILIPNKSPDAAAQIQAIRRKIDDQVNAEMAKLPPSADAATRDKERAAVVVRVFAEEAKATSTCPSKAKGGELGAFPRVGSMVEPFAKAAFALKPYQMSEPVSTEFGLHIILCTEVRPGRAVKFEDVRGFVQDVYGERLREAVIAAYKPRSKIVINEAK